MTTTNTRNATELLDATEIAEIVEMTGASTETVIRCALTEEANVPAYREFDMNILVDRIIESVEYEISQGRN